MTGLGFVVPIAIFLLARAFSGKPKPPEERAPTTTSTRTAPPVAGPQPQMESGPPQPLPTWASWLGLDGPATAPPLPGPSPVMIPVPTPVPSRGDQYGHGFDRVESTTQWGGAFDHQSSAEDEVLKWGSAFENDMDGEPIRWKSAFDEDDRKNTYGFKGIQWDSGFPPKSSEPVIYLG